MSNPVLFISDLHLDPSRPQVTQAFCSFLETDACAASALYILGDLFEYWIGDDQPKLGFESVIHSLKALRSSGVPVYFICGNRDFLLGDEMAAACGMEILADETVVYLFGTPTLIMHGDSLCTDDVDYQSLRTLLRSPEWQKEFLAAPMEARIQQAQALREQSQKEIQTKSEYITDVNPDAVLESMTCHKVTRLIHGHTHRPAIHDLTIGDAAGQRIVLGDWYDQGSVLSVDADGVSLSSLAFDTDDTD